MPDFEKLVENFFSKKEKIWGTQELSQTINEIFIEALVESKYGISKFKNKEKNFFLDSNPSNILSLQDMIVLPNGGGKFQSKEETKKSVDDAIAQIKKQNNVEAVQKEVNQPDLSAYMIVFIGSQDKKAYIFTRYYKEMNADGMGKWKEGDFKSQTGLKDVSIGASGDKDVQKISASQIESMPIKPIDLSLGDNSIRSLQQILETVKASCNKRVSDKSLPEIVAKHLILLLENAISGGENPVLEGGAPYAKAYDKSFGEILAPISLLTGWGPCTGDREKSAKNIMKVSDKKSISYSPEMKVSFNVSKNEALVDSTVHYQSGENDFRVRISSKASKKGGAPSSLVTAWETYSKLQIKGDVSEFKQFDNFIYILRTIGLNTSYEGPIALAQALNGMKGGFLLSKELSLLIQHPEDNLPIWKKTKIPLEQFNKQYMIYLNSKEYPNLKKMWEGFGSKSVVAPAIRLISSIAKACSEEINSNDELYKFDAGMRKILDSSLIQINSNVKVTGKNCQFTEFKVKYPPVFEGKILFDSTKNYTGDAIAGKFCFKVP